MVTSSGGIAVYKKGPSDTELIKAAVKVFCRTREKGGNRVEYIL